MNPVFMPIIFQSYAKKEAGDYIDVSTNPGHRYIIYSRRTPNVIGDADQTTNAMEVNLL
jgi:hypothetical protein